MLISAPEWLEKPNRLKVPHKGIVVDNNDPKKLGRVKVMIDALFLGIVTADLPWVAVWNGAGTGGALLSSSFAVPEVDSELIIEFPYDDIYFPFYTGYWQSSVTHQLLFDTNYPERYGFRDSTGVEVHVDKSDTSAKLLHPSGAYVTIDAQGNVIVTTPGTLTMHSDLDMNISSGTHLILAAPRIDLN